MELETVEESLQHGPHFVPGDVSNRNVADDSAKILLILITYCLCLVAMNSY